MIRSLPTVLLAQEDFQRLKLLAARLPRPPPGSDAPALRDELDRAIVLPRELLPAGIVTLGSRVRFVDRATGEEEEYTLTWPEQADPSEQRLSVLAPIGTALLGFQEGDEFEWPTPGGVRRLRIIAVGNPPGAPPDVAA